MWRLTFVVVQMANVPASPHYVARTLSIQLIVLSILQTLRNPNLTLL